MIGTLLLPLIIAMLFLSMAMALAWAVQRRTGNSGWIDVIWTFATGLGAWIGLALLAGDTMLRLVLAALVGAWSLRLGLHILARTRRTADDPRYARLMADWGASAPRRLFLFLQVQALAAFVLVLAVLLAGMAEGAGGARLVIAALALAALIGEGAADAQLAAFQRQRPAGRICETGLWGRSRHPNYFFEWLFWCAIAAMALAPPQGAASFLALLAPALMYVLLRHVSGVPHLESHMQRTRPEAFADYARRVPVFFPRLWRSTPRTGP